MMTLTIELSPEIEAQLQTQARLRGLEPNEIARRLLAEHLPPVLSEEELARRQSVMDEFVAESERLGIYQ